MTKFQATVSLKAIIGFPVFADSPEDALKLARTKMKDMSFVNPKLEYIDGREELSGVSGDWDWMDES